MSTFEEQLKDSLSNAYDIERELGGGGMSRVFVATDRLLGRKVVIKVLSPELTAEVNRGRFRREIQVAAQLQHPHIVTLFAAGEHNDLVYYTMPFIDGESLKGALEKQGRLSVAEVIRVLYDVVDALSYAHRHGVIHRDIKPGNILRSGNHAMVTDFGVAKALGASMSSSAMTSTGMAIGTPAYMAPEQLAGDPSADHRVDLYAVGLLAYELLTGQSPFAATTAQGVLAAVLTRDPKPLHEVRKEVPRKLSTIIMSCLSKIPGGRPPNAEALLDSLDMIATSSGEIRTREHKVPRRTTTPIVAMPAVSLPAEPTPVATPVLTPAATAPPIVVPMPMPTYAEEPPRRRRSPLLLVGGLLAIGTAAAAAVMIWKKPDVTSPVTIEPPKAANASPAPASPNVVAQVAPVDSMAIVAAITQRLAAEAEAKAKAKGNSAPVNADSLKRVVQRQIADSMAKANAKAKQLAAAAAAATPSSAPATTTAAPEPAPVAAAPAPPPPPASGKKRLAITGPRDTSQPVLNAFTNQFIQALRASLDAGDSFDPIDQDEVRSAFSQAGSRDAAAKILKPDVMVWPGYTGTGDTVNVVVTVWDMRSNSSYGIRVTSSKIVPSNPENYLGALVQSVMKQLNDLDRTPTIYRRQ